MRVQKLVVAAVILGALAVVPAEATIISVAGAMSSFPAPAAIIPAPPQVLNSTVTNFAQQGFNERQGVLLLAPLAVDTGSIAAGTLVDSHMIFLNQEDGTLGNLNHEGVTWTFSGVVLGVMSDQNGLLEGASTALLGWPGTVYPAPFASRGLEGADSYSVVGNQITLNMHVSQPGDWVRVVTASPVPEPGSLLLIGSGLAGLVLRRRRR